MSQNAPAQALTGLRVIDFSQYLAGPTVSMVLADLGARVIRVDPPGGARWKHHANAALHRGKESVVLDFEERADAETARALVAGADIVIESFRPGTLERFGLDAQASVAANPAVIYCSIPGFSRDDPRSGWAAWEGVVSAAAGLYLRPGCSPMNYVGDRTRDPIFTAVPQASAYAAVVAAHSIAAALVARERWGYGQSIEVPLFDASFELIGASVQRNVDLPLAPTAPPPAPGDRRPELGHYRCADGEWLELCLFQEKHLRWFGERFMPAEWIDDGMADAARLQSDPELRVRARTRFAELLRTKPAREWEIDINETSGASAALAQSSESWLRDDAHARDSGAVVDLADPVLGLTAQLGFPITLSATPLAVAGARRSDDADTVRIRREISNGSWAAPRFVPSDHVPPGSDGGALQGMRVVDVSQVLAGPTTSRVLAEYGASVIKVHSFDDRQLGMHLYTNSGKQSIMLDLKTVEGKRLLDALVRGVDVFVQNFTRGVAERIGIGYDDVRTLSPDVVYTSISAFGYEGYRGGWRGREQLGQGVTGMQARLGGVGEEPRMAPWPYNDFSTGNWAAFGAIVALYHRLRGGSGQQVHASLSSSATFLQIPFMVAWEGATWDEPAGEDAKGWTPTDRLYQTADGWVYLAAPTAEGVAELAGVRGLEGLPLGEDDRELAEWLATALMREKSDEWVQRIVGGCRHASVSVLEDLEQVMRSDVAVDRGLSIVRDHPGVGRMRMAGPSARLSRTPPRATRPVGRPGSDTAAVVAAAGPDVSLDQLLAAGAVREGLPDGAEFIGMFR